MKLPQINAPKYEVKLFSVDNPVKYRPFLVKEQKILLMAAESKDRQEISAAMIQCLKHCVETELDIENLPVFDLIYLFLKIRAKSAGEIMELKYECDHVNEDGSKCGGEVGFSLNLDELQLTIPEGHTTVIKLTDTVGVKMKYPSLNTSVDHIDINSPLEQISIVVDCIESIYTEDEVIDASDVDKTELIEFIDSMSTDQLKEIMGFFKTCPTVEIELDVVCPKCGTKRKITLNELESFF